MLSEETLNKIAKSIALLGGSAVAVKIILTFLGFTVKGIAPNSFAAYIQALIGNVSSGSLFALLQSLAAKEVIMFVATMGAIVIVVVATAYGGYKLYQFCKEKPSL